MMVTEPIGLLNAPPVSTSMIGRVTIELLVLIRFVLPEGLICIGFVGQFPKLMVSCPLPIPVAVA